MRFAAVAALLLVAGPVRAQDAGNSTDDEVRRQMELFFERLLAVDIKGVVELAAFPFFLDGKWLPTPDDLRQELQRHLQPKRMDLVELRGLELLAPSDMERKYGPPPRRLAAIPWRTGKSMVGIANLSGHSAVAVLRYTGKNGWKVAAYSD